MIKCIFKLCPCDVKSGSRTLGCELFFMNSVCGFLVPAVYVIWMLSVRERERETKNKQKQNIRKLRDGETERLKEALDALSSNHTPPTPPAAALVQR